MKKVFDGFALALSMLSILPFFKVHDFYKGINGYAVTFYPFIGFFLGILLFGIYELLLPYFPHFHLGVTIFALWVLLTGALHLDGLSDTVDGLFVPKERSLEVMKDPHNGGMGMTFGAVFLILKASSLIALDAFYLLPVVLLLSRLVVVFAIYKYPYVSPNGMSTLAKEEFTQTQLLTAFGYSLFVIYLFDAWMLFVAAFVTLFVIKAFFMKRYGGFTGDIYGFSIEMVELILLNCIIVGLV
ncbi:adenosylcobinamide-GDP ribazoletransferase [Sulfurimonas sp.]|uniref:adenosylcobinamide-GDP ribazoletransferase n=1 Tax=Sulfurimonas sp. TaxID=2022749 RepID=UPI00262711C0|nr:adenosylcobinamide-GDP ribazoletransferase [Sulfurimonas sp.]